MKIDEMEFEKVLENYNYVMNTSDELEYYQTDVIMNGYEDHMEENSKALKMETELYKIRDKFSTIEFDLNSGLIAFIITFLAGKVLEGFFKTLVNIL